MTTGTNGSPSTLAEALVNLRGKLKNPERNSVNPYYGSKYAKLEDIIKEVRDLLFEQRLTFTQNIISEQNTIMAQTIFIHASGEERTIDGPKVILEKFTPQAVGAVCTYAKRYSLLSALGVEADEDDDANTAEDDFKDVDNTEHPAERQETTGPEPVELITVDFPEGTRVIGRAYGGDPIDNEEDAKFFLHCLELHMDLEVRNPEMTDQKLRATYKKLEKDLQDCQMLAPEEAKKVKPLMQKMRKKLKENQDGA
tara:strand:- start:127 stop:888 length:762 start_codon:yes stop_codon:yes gene_type:complete